ncbi:MAG: flagellar export chaperone FliS [Sedimentisphaerales bacterium]|nr:flagellar export chaperone FliS [Sedimentisphaerales bacterium]
MDGIATYQDNTVSTQSKGRLISMLYDRAIKFMVLAIMEMEKKNHEAKGRHINKALDIIDELNAALDMDSNSKIARNLRKQYNFMSNRLSLANTKDDPQIVCDVIKQMEELNKIWKVFN